MDRVEKKSLPSELYIWLNATVPYLLAFLLMYKVNFGLGVLVLALLNIIFIYLDALECDKIPTYMNGWVFVGFLIPCAYTFVREKRTAKNMIPFIIQCAFIVLCEILRLAFHFGF